MDPKSYHKLSTLIKNYFVLLASTRGCDKDYWVEEIVDRLGFSTYIITVKTPECDKVMQKVLDDANN